jgi:hypothetical protein
MSATAPNYSARQASASPLAGRADLRRILHDLDDATVLEILNLSPTVAEVEQAALWATGDGHALDRAGHPLSGIVARIVGILQREEEPDR